MEKRNIKLWKLIGLLSLTLVWACDDEDLPLSNCIEARVIDVVCGQAVIQIVSEAHDHIGQDNWTDLQGNVYDNVFGTMLDCEDMGVVNQEAGTFLIKLLDEPEEQNCVVCLALPAAMPELRLTMKVVESCEGL